MRKLPRPKSSIQTRRIRQNKIRKRQKSKRTTKQHDERPRNTRNNAPENARAGQIRRNSEHIMLSENFYISYDILFLWLKK